MVSFRFKRPCMPPVVITQRRLTLPARSDRSGAAFRNRWGTVSKEVGHRYDREPKSAPLPVETAPHFVRNCAPLPVGISAPFRPESANGSESSGPGYLNASVVAEENRPSPVAFEGLFCEWLRPIPSGAPPESMAN